MSLLASAADFEQGGLYEPPYSRFPFFQTRLDELKQRFAPTGQKLLIVGCGYGYLVDDAVTAGYDAWGVDASAYAINKGKTLLPAIANRLIVADALVGAQLDAAATTAGLKRNVKWPLLVTEDVLTVMSDAEVQTCLTNTRARCSTNLLHFVIPGDPQTEPSCDPRINWKTIDAWRAVLCPPDVVGDCETNLFWNANGQV